MPKTKYWKLERHDGWEYGEDDPPAGSVPMTAKEWEALNDELDPETAEE